MQYMLSTVFGTLTLADAAWTRLVGALSYALLEMRDHADWCTRLYSAEGLHSLISIQPQPDNTHSSPARIPSPHM